MKIHLVVALAFAFLASQTVHAFNLDDLLGAGKELVDELDGKSDSNKGSGLDVATVAILVICAL